MTEHSHARRRRAACAAAAAVLAAWLLPQSARAAELEGVRMPDTIDLAGTRLVLNGIGLRTFSMFKIGVYVAGLYLDRKTHDALAILDSPSVKVLDVHFVHDADAERVRNAWREGFETDCRLPCQLPPAEVEKFLAAVPDMHQGDVSRLVYTQDYVSIAVNGHELGRVTNPAFMRVLLATFIGDHPPTDRLKRELLGGKHE